jgi:hypothetical protein
VSDLGSLVIKLSAETAQFRSDLGKSAHLLDKTANEMKTSMERLSSMAHKTFALAIGVTSVVAIKDLVVQTIEAAASLQGLAEQAGASAEALSGFAPVAMISGTSLQSLSMGMFKLSKAMADSIRAQAEQAAQGTSTASSGQPKADAVGQATGAIKLKPLNYSVAARAQSATATLAMDGELKGLQSQIDAQSQLLKDRNAVIDLYASQGLMSWRESAAAKLAAEGDYTEQLSGLYAKQETVLKHGLQVTASTTQERIKLQTRLDELLAKRGQMQQSIMQGALQRSVQAPGLELKDIQEQAKRAQSELSQVETVIRGQRDSGGRFAFAASPRIRVLRPCKTRPTWTRTPR